MPREPINTTDWGAVAARAQALHLAGLAEKSLTERAKFLMILGMNRADAAALLGSSDDSLRIMLARDAKKEPSTKAKLEAAGA
jgi:hypothetical protein